MTGLKVTGWGLFGWPGEKKRIDAAVKKADAALDALDERNEFGELEYSLETEFDFTTGNAVVHAHVAYTHDVTVAELTEVRRQMISAVLEEALLVNSEVKLSPNDIVWSTDETRDKHSRRLTRGSADATLEVAAP